MANKWIKTFHRHTLAFETKPYHIKDGHMRLILLPTPQVYINLFYGFLNLRTEQYNKTGDTRQENQ